MCHSAVQGGLISRDLLQRHRRLTGPVARAVRCAFITLTLTYMQRAVCSFTQPGCVPGAVHAPAQLPLSHCCQWLLAVHVQGPHFWDECPYPPQGSCKSVGPSGDFQAYINLFSRAADLIRTRPDAITGVFTHSTVKQVLVPHTHGHDARWARGRGGVLCCIVLR